MKLNIITYLAIMIFSGIAFGRLVKQIKLPNVTGYLIAGLIIGPSVLGIVPDNIISSAGIISDVALGFIAFSIGNEFKISYFKKVGMAPIIIAVFEASLAVVFVLAALMVAGYPFAFAVIMGAIAAATDPAATIMVIRQYKAKGKVSEMLMSVAALDDAVALILFGVAVAAAQAVKSSGEGHMSGSLIKPFIEIFGALILGAILGLLFALILKFFQKNGNCISITVGFVFAAVGIAKLLDFSPLLLCMAMGTILANLSDGSDKIMNLTDYITPPIFILFFVDSGASLNISALSGIGVIGIIYILFRVLGKTVGVITGSKLCKCDKNITKYLSFALVPQAGVAIGLSLVTMTIIPEYSDVIRTVVLCSTLIYELLGPALSKYALTKSGDIKTQTA